MADFQPTLFQEFHKLLRKAAQAAEFVDMFNLYSDNPASVEKWKELLNEQKLTSLELVEFCRRNPLIVTQIVNDNPRITKQSK